MRFWPSTWPGIEPRERSFAYTASNFRCLSCRDGQPRQMAFVGYRTVEAAAAALKYFNNTFIDTSRVSIEVCRDG